MVGFVYSIVGMKGRQVLQWSHMLGVLRRVPQQRARPGAEARPARAGAGRRLRPHRVDVRSAAGAERAPELRQARRRRRGIPPQRLRRVDAACCTGARRPIAWWRSGGSASRTSSGGWRQTPGLTARSADLTEAQPVNTTRPAHGVAGQRRGRPGQGRAAAAARDSDGLHRHAARGARSRARVADADPGDLRDLFRPRLPGGRLLPRSPARGAAATCCQEGARHGADSDARSTTLLAKQTGARGRPSRAWDRGSATCVTRVGNWAGRPGSPPPPSPCWPSASGSTPGCSRWSTPSASPAAPFPRPSGSCSSTRAARPPRIPIAQFSFPAYQQLAGNDAFTGVLAHNPGPGRRRRGGQARRTLGVVVSRNYFDVLGVPLLQGRGFTTEEGRPGQDLPVAVRHLRLLAAARVRSRTGRIDGPDQRAAVHHRRRRAPRLHRHDDGVRPGVLLPARRVPLDRNDFDGQAARRLEPADAYNLFLVGRLAPGVTAAAAEARLPAAAAGLATAMPAAYRDARITLAPLPRFSTSTSPIDESRGDAGRPR